MRYFIIIDKTNGNVESKFTWGDDRDLPANYPLQPNQEIVVLHEEGESLDVFNTCYNKDTKTFEPKLTITSDVQQISHIDSVANITITYPSAVNEVCYFSIDGQTVELDIIDGKATVQFANEVIGHHLITVASSTHYGKNQITIEVV